MKPYLTWRLLKSHIRGMTDTELDAPVLIEGDDDADCEFGIFVSVGINPFADCGHQNRSLLVNTDAEYGPIYMKGQVHEQPEKGK